MDWLINYFNYYFKKEVKINEKEIKEEEEIKIDENSFVILNNDGDNGGGIKIILSLDGGGMRGIVSILLLKEIQKILELDIGFNCDIICGTSTGGILAYSKLYDVENDELLELYSEFGKKIFPLSSMEIIRNVYQEGTLFSTKELISIMKSNFENKKCSNRKGFVVTIAQDKKTAIKDVKIFANYENPNSITTGDNLHDNDITSIVDIIRSTAGIPGLFNLYENDNFIYYDGGFQYNCNLPIALIESSSLYPNASKLLFISIGTGYCKTEKSNYYCSNINTDLKVEEFLKTQEIEEAIKSPIIKPKLGGIFDLFKNLYTLYKEYTNMPETYIVLKQFLKDHESDPNIFTYRFDVELEFDISLHDSSLKAENEMKRSVLDYVNDPNNQFNRSILNIKKLIELNNKNLNK